jgi:hypothetical protein
MREARPGVERAAARVRLAAQERRRGQLDLAGLQLMEALREGAAASDAGAELAALLAADPSERGAERALHCFAALLLPGRAGDPFPGVGGVSRSAAVRAELFRATFRGLDARSTGALAEAIAGGPVGARPEGDAFDWKEALRRDVAESEGRALDALYGRLLGAARTRVTARLDTPGPIHELSAQRIALEPPGTAGEGSFFDLAFAGDEQLYLLRRAGGKLILRRNRLVAFQQITDESELLAGVRDLAAPRLVGSAGGAFAVGIDGEGMLHVSFSAGQGELLRGERKVGRGVALAAACECAAGLAVFLDAGGRAVVFGRDGRFSREKRVGPAAEVLSAASQSGSDLVVLARGTRECSLRFLDADLEPRGDPVPVPYLRSPVDARVEWPTADLVLVVERPDVAHAFGADDHKLAWTARIREPLSDLAPAVSEELELVSFGPIEDEWGQAEGDLGVARWTRDGLGRHGPTVRVEGDPGAAMGDVKLVSRGNLLALAWTARAPRSVPELSQRLLVLVPVPPALPAPAEWTFTHDALPPG